MKNPSSKSQDNHTQQNGVRQEGKQKTCPRHRGAGDRFGFVVSFVGVAVLSDPRFRCTHDRAAEDSGPYGGGMWDFIGLPGLQTGLRLGQLLGDVQDVVTHTFKVG